MLAGGRLRLIDSDEGARGHRARRLARRRLDRAREPRADRPARGGRRPRDLRDHGDALRRPCPVGGPARARDRGLPLVVVVNRMPADAPSDRSTVLDDVDRLLDEFGIDASGLDRGPGRLARVPAIPEGAIDGGHRWAGGDAVAPLRSRIEALGADTDARRALAARALAGSLAGLAPLVDRVADDLEHEAIEADALRRFAAHAFESEAAALRERLAPGTFLRAEALRQWQAFVGADEITRLLLDAGSASCEGRSPRSSAAPRAPRSRRSARTRSRTSPPSPDRMLPRRRAVRRPLGDERSDARAHRRRPEPVEHVAPIRRRPSVRLEGWVDGIADDVQTTGGRSGPSRRAPRSGSTPPASG